MKQPNGNSWERVAVFYGITKIAGVAWNERLSDKLIASQNKLTGEIKAGKGDMSSRAPLLATSYALLFLQKATKKLKKYETKTAK